MANSTKLNDYIEELRNEIENIDSVRICEIYGGQFENGDLSKIKVDLRVAGQCHVFLDLGGLSFEKDNVHGEVYADCVFEIIIVGAFDRTTKGYSLDCANTSTDIIKMINEKANKIAARRQPGFTQLGDSQQLANAISNNQRYSVWIQNFTQRIRIE